MLEDIPGEPKGIEDVVWCAAMGSAVGLIGAGICALGVLTGRALRARRSPTPL